MNSTGSKRVFFLDGIRGWAALIVVFCHLYQSWLYPPGKYPYSDFFYHTPFRLSVDGASAVAMFFLLSGFALSYSFFSNNAKQALISAAQFRYFRLTIPIFFSVLLAYIFIKLGLMYTHQAAVGVYMNDISFIGILKYSFFKIFYASITQHYDYGPQLWTLSIEFFGSLLVFGYLALFGDSKCRYFFYLIFILVLSHIGPYYGLFFVGVFLCDIYCLNEKEEIIRLGTESIWQLFFKKHHINKFFVPIKKLIINDFLMGGFFLFLYQHQMVLRSKPFLPIIYLFIWVLISPNLKSFFSNSLSKFLGRISFALYLTHFLVLCSLSRYLYALLLHFGFKIKLISFLVSAVNIPVSLVVAYFFSLFIEESLLKQFKLFLIKNKFIEGSESSMVNLSTVNYSHRQKDWGIIFSRFKKGFAF